MHHRFFSVLLWGCLCALPTGNALASSDEPVDTRKLSCDITYAGQTQHVSVAPTSDPYRQTSIPIRNRFRFKAVHVQGDGVTPRIGIYVYFETPQQPLLIQHVLLQPPYPQAPAGTQVDLLGEQRLYAGPLERELIYRCFLRQDTP